MITKEVLNLVFTGLGATAAIIGAGGIVYAAWTFRFNTWLKAQEIYMDKEFREAREKVLGYFGCKEKPAFIDKMREHALLVCRKMDELARLEWYVDKEKIIETWGIPMGKSWIILEKLVHDKRKHDNNENKWDAFKKIGEEAAQKYNLRQKQ